MPEAGDHLAEQVDLADADAVEPGDGARAVSDRGSRADELGAEVGTVAAGAERAIDEPRQPEQQ